MLSRGTAARTAFLLAGQDEKVKISTIGSRAWLIEAPGDFALPAQRRIWALAAALGRRDEVESVIPGVTNLLVLFRQTQPDSDLVYALLHQLWEQALAVSPVGKLIEIPVVYGGKQAIDLDTVCRHSGLPAAEVIRRHYQGDYTVFALGSAPGFAYLHGLDRAIATPRKRVPSLHMLKGTVTIGGAQTGVSALNGPNGWNAIGFADITVFDAGAAEPALMAPGDSVRFLPARIEL
ncbi:5-oxoprolinase subunit PxpB [Acerihabitans sp.]|uniref:5-oxoprolinase subunit PxpB n=1 Tax=Acerihabitans sp. TaxID=2811394 RepID=UPI002ED7B61A